MTVARMRLMAASGALLAAVVVMLQAPPDPTQIAAATDRSVELKSTGIPLAPTTTIKWPVLAWWCST